MRALRAPRHRAGGAAGFLLVEALAALALGALILVALLSLTGIMRRSADRAAARVETIEVASRTLDTIARELRQAARLRWAQDPEQRQRAASQPSQNQPQGAEANPAQNQPANQAPRQTATAEGEQNQANANQTSSEGAADAGRAFVFAGAPDRVAFALTPVLATGLRAAVFVAYQIDEAGGVLRVEGPLPATATGPAAIRLSPVYRIDPGPERLRFAFVDRAPDGGEVVTDAWAELSRMPAAVRIDRSDPATGAPLGSLRVPLLVDGEFGCGNPGKKAFCSRKESGGGRSDAQGLGRNAAAGEPQ